jgi:hypothetical protein
VTRIGYIFTLALIISVGFLNGAMAQNNPLRGVGNRIGQPPVKAQSGADTFSHRTGLEDSLTIRFRFLDTSRLRNFDSSIIDFTKKFPTPWHHIHLGNLGNASRNLLFSPNMKPGWDHGFHAYDNYNFTVAETQFFNTTRPYAELNYLLGSQSEQLIRLMHTQNIDPNWNVAVEYRLINSPGYFQNQNTNHNNYRFTSWFQSKNRRYQNFVLVIGNKLQSGENGGIRNDLTYLDSTGTYDDRATIPTELGPNIPGSRNFFSTAIAVGTYYTNATYLLRQQYDIGQKDSLVVNDSTVVPLFYPRLRLEHTISYNTFKYRFRDNQADSLRYDSLYNISLAKSIDTFFLQDHWRVLVNDFSIYQFPDAKNSQQFFKAGATLENIQGILDSGRLSKNYYNFLVHAEYRNKTRNQKWDILAGGNFYINGLNSGDYNAHVSLKRYIGKRTGLEVGFQNTNRTPSFTYDALSTFYLHPVIDTFKKENITSIFGSLDIPSIKLSLSAQYYLVSNYLYYVGYYQPAQTPTLFNVLRVSLYKQFGIARNFHWRTWTEVQQRLGDGPLNLPLVTTRNQIGYDGNLSFKNLNTSFGLEFRYFTSYKAPSYSPFIGQYSFQDTVSVRQKAPDISAYLHFRIKTFNAYIRAENLNTLDFGTGKFLRNNVPTRIYPYPGLQIRVGIFWSFVN